MTKDDFQDNAQSMEKKSTIQKKEDLNTLIQAKPQPSGPRPPAPKSPFDRPMMPSSVKVKLMHPAMKDKSVETFKSSEEIDQES